MAKQSNQIFDILENATDEEKAEIAAEILSDCDPNREAMETFMRDLEDTTKAELSTYFADYLENEDK